MKSNDTRDPSPVPPWWRVGMVWLIIGGPLTVVAASMVTVTIAYVGAEEVLTQPTKQISTEDAARLPAMQGRNHVSTPRN